ncbi:DUF2987 domain-containing protein [Aliiglaciecola sp. LCG003]|uniref:DUF2987 domain-containing protein n=1 Tax=Aliiglaciecola sp. LCG003 TaxID=3053655 RepID=UPI0025733D58|nr:DUF2987 domain-containing protein [Aliiglaciecola sp. LCG003]WJG07597.1 DUF2987 domain-containing protein [Aliiglaciecola sp. LCG003]
MKKLVIIVLNLFIFNSIAEPLSVDYGNFYSHLKKIDDEDTPALQFAFGFKNIDGSGLCHIKQVKIVTQKVTLPVEITAEQRFLLPTEKALKQAKAMVVLTLTEANNKCDMSVQLETKNKYLKTQYSNQELVDLLNQYDQFFDDMGGFLSFMMPDVDGLNFHIENLAVQPMAQGVVSDNGHIFLSKSWIEQGKDLTLSSAPHRITAITKQ